MRLDHKLKISILSCRHLDIQDFAELVYLSQTNAVGWMENFYFHYRMEVLPRQRAANVLDALIVGVNYSRGEYHRFLKLRPGDKVQLVDKFDYDPSINWIKVEEIEPYEMADIEKRVLIAIRETEKKREKYNLSHQG